MDPERRSPTRVLVVEGDVPAAAARTPSLRRFIETMARFMGLPQPELARGAGRYLPRDVLANLLAEVPGGEIVWRDSDGGVHTASQMRGEIEAGTELGRAYASDLLRVSRDLLLRQARRSASP